jgi:hypothetical protein
MIYLGVLIGIGIIGSMIYLAVDKKSNLAIRIASLIALGIMVLSIVICLIIIFTDNRVPVDPSMLIVGAPVEIDPDSGGNFWVLLLLILVLLGMFSLIAYQAMKENRKSTKDAVNNKKDFIRNFDF